VSEHLTPQELVVSATSLALAQLALRLTAAASRYADGAAKVDTPGPDQQPLVWQLAQDLGDLAAEIHDVRRRLQAALYGESKT